MALKRSAARADNIAETLRFWASSIHGNQPAEPPSEISRGRAKRTPRRAQMVGIGIVGIGFMGMKLTSVRTGLGSRPSLLKDAPDAGFRALVRICESLETFSLRVGSRNSALGGEK